MSHSPSTEPADAAGAANAAATAGATDAANAASDGSASDAGQPRRVPTAAPQKPKKKRRRGKRGWVPNYHGAWGMLVLPAVVGIVVGGWSWMDAVVLPAWWGAYFSYWVLTQWLRTRSPRKRAPLRTPLAVYSAIPILLALISLACAPYLAGWGLLLIPLAAVAVHQSWRGKERSLLSGSATTLAASLMALVVYDLGTGGRGGWLGLGPEASELRGQSLNGSLTGWPWMWLLTGFLAAYFVGAVPYVKTMIRRRGDPRMIIGSIGFHAVVTAAALGCAVAGLMSWLHALVWVLLLLRAVALPMLQRRRMDSGQKLVPVKLVGRLEVVASLLVVLGLLLG